MISSLDAFYLRLADFEGPLPLLLHLIEKNELEVTRVSIAAVADQFIVLVAADGSSDLATTGEFVAVAARLLLIKSRALLFRGELGGELTDDQDDAATLARQIAEYARYQQGARAIAARLEGDCQTWPRPAPGPIADRPVTAPRIRLDALATAGRRLLARREVAGEDVSGWPEVVYASIRADLLTEVRRLGVTTFAAMCKREWHPLVIITMFLAVLDAVRLEQLSMRQHSAFGPIELRAPAVEAAHA